MVYKNKYLYKDGIFQWIALTVTFLQENDFRQKKITMGRTLIDNRTEITKEAKDINNREDPSRNIYQGDDNDTVFPSYVVINKSGENIL